MYFKLFLNEAGFKDLSLFQMIKAEKFNVFGQIRVFICAFRIDVARAFSFVFVRPG